MAVVVTLEFSNATTKQYDQVLEKMNLGGRMPPNGIFHVCADNGEGGLYIVDTWDTAEAFHDFSEKQIGPLTAEVGITEPPKVTVRPVHNFLERR